MKAAHVLYLLAVVKAARNLFKPGQTDWATLRKALDDLDEYEKNLKAG